MFFLKQNLMFRRLFLLIAVGMILSGSCLAEVISLPSGGLNGVANFSGSYDSSSKGVTINGDVAQAGFMGYYKLKSSQCGGDCASLEFTSSSSKGVNVSWTSSGSSFTSGNSANLTKTIDLSKASDLQVCYSVEYYSGGFTSPGHCESTPIAPPDVSCTLSPQQIKILHGTVQGSDLDSGQSFESSAGVTINCSGPTTVTFSLDDTELTLAKDSSGSIPTVVSELTISSSTLNVNNIGNTNITSTLKRVNKSSDIVGGTYTSSAVLTATWL
ncbi:hypothetical protein [Lelliottia nimipressuralis]|uniref:hypothetical protein n=1 Tax=Lelliottia nimipressuralis TaxID=69220 RepID=UPI003D1B6802